MARIEPNSSFGFVLDKYDDDRSQRLVKELRATLKDNRWSPDDKSTIYEVHPTDLDRWTVWLAGPAEGPYSAGVWELSVTIPPDYPHLPPTICFVTPIYHPYVCQTSGKVAWLLGDWSPALSMRVILYSLHSMLVDVKVDAFEACWSENKLMQSMIQQLASDRADYDRVARKWTQAHAVGASHFLRRCSPAIRRRALYLMWVARQLEALHGLPATALLDPWVEFVVPLCVFVPDKTRQDKSDCVLGRASTISRAPSVEEEAEAKVRDLGGRSRCPSIPKEEWVQRTWAQRLKMLEDALSDTSSPSQENQDSELARRANNLIDSSSAAQKRGGKAGLFEQLRKRIMGVARSWVYEQRAIINVVGSATDSERTSLLSDQDIV